MTTAEYAVLVRNPRTLAVVGEIPPQDIASLRWTRLPYEAGPWALALPRATARAMNAAVGTDILARQHLVEIRRDGDVEYQGVILDRSLDAQGLMWTVEGRDLKDWLHRRIVGVTTAEAQSGTAETVLKAYVEAHLGATAGTFGGVSRVATDALAGGKTWSIEADVARGDAVEISAQRIPLARVVADICRQGNIWYDVVLTDAGYELRVYDPVNATTASGGTPFAVNLDNVEGLGYREAYGSVATGLLVAGGGTGDTRTTREVVDAAAIATDFLREGVAVESALTTNDQLDAYGAAEIARQLGAAVAADVVPLTGSANARYRQDWDLAWDVTVAIPAADVAAIERRIVAVNGSLTRDAGERITFALGVERPKSTLRRLSRALQRLQDAAAV